MSTSYILKSIADDTRLSIIRKLHAEKTEVSCHEIMNDCTMALNLSQPTMSHHLSKLVQSGVILEQKVGKEKHYALNTELLSSVGINPGKL